MKSKDKSNKEAKKPKKDAKPSKTAKPSPIVPNLVGGGGQTRPK